MTKPKSEQDNINQLKGIKETADQFSGIMMESLKYLFSREDENVSVDAVAKNLHDFASKELTTKLDEMYPDRNEKGGLKKAVISMVSSFIVFSYEMIDSDEGKRGYKIGFCHLIEHNRINKLIEAALKFSNQPL